MLLHAVIVPPRTVLDVVAHVVQSVPAPDTAAPPQPPEPAKGFLRRRSNRGYPAAPSSNEPEQQLELIPTEQLFLPLTDFGNVTSTDASRLEAALRTAAATWARPTVHFAGGAVLELARERSIWAKLDGELGPLTTVAKGVIQSVENLGFYLDRRTFRPQVMLASLNKETTVPYVESVVAALDAFRGEAWTIDSVSLMRRSFASAQPPSTELSRIPLAPP